MGGFRSRRRLIGSALVATAVTAGVVAGSVGTASAWDAGIQVCKAADNSNGTVTGSYQFTVSGTQDGAAASTTVSVGVGQCSDSMLFDEGSVTISEAGSSGTTLVGITTDPASALQSSDLTARTATVSITNFTTVVATFTNENENTPPPSNGCTLTWGYYKTHSSVVTSLMNGGTLLVGSANLTATQVNALLAINENGSNYLIKLVHQLIAAELDQLGGASTPAAVQTAIDAANALIAQQGGASGAASSSTTVVFGGKTYSASGLTGALDAYNKGLAAGGPSHCGS